VGRPELGEPPRQFAAKYLFGRLIDEASENRFTSAKRDAGTNIAAWVHGIDSMAGTTTARLAEFEDRGLRQKIEKPGVFLPKCLLGFNNLLD
jgi:hypothetical protein